MDMQWMAQQLPESPPEGLLEWAKRAHGEQELGGEFCIWSSERTRPEDGSTQWVADCICTACTEDFITQKEPGEKAIRLIFGEDGGYYPVEPGEPVDPYMGIELQRDGDDFYCPSCGSKVELIHRSKLRGGRTKRILVISLAAVQGYAVVIYWMVCRSISEFGASSYYALPEEAYVLTERGGLKRFTHVHRHGAFFGANRTRLLQWQPMSNSEDVLEKCYPDWRSINGKKCGGDVFLTLPDLEGTTGEKTAVEAFLQAGGYRVLDYLKWWRRCRNVENLCRQGCAKLVVDIMRKSYRFSYSVDAEAAKYVDLSEAKPHRMLGISKEEFRWLRENGLELNLDRLAQWKKYKAAGGKLGFGDFMELASRAGNSSVNAALEILSTWGDDFDRVARYLEKRGCRLNEAGILLDARKAMTDLYGRELSELEENLVDLRRQAEEAAAKEDEATAKVDKLKGQLAKAKEAEKAAKADLEAAKTNPQIPEATLEQLRKEVAAQAAAKATEDLQKMLSDAQAQVLKAEQERQQAEEAAAAAQKAAKLSGADAAVFKLLFTQVQEDFNKLMGALMKVRQSDAELGNKLTAEVQAVLDKTQRDLLGW